MSCLSVAIATASWPASRPPRSPSWPRATPIPAPHRSEEHTSELQSRLHLVCRLLLEKKKKTCRPRRSHTFGSMTHRLAQSWRKYSLYSRPHSRWTGQTVGHILPDHHDMSPTFAHHA